MKGLARSVLLAMGALHASRAAIVTTPWERRFTQSLPGIVAWDADGDQRPDIAVDASSGAIVAVWSQPQGLSASDYDIYFSRSADGGASFSAPALLMASFATDAADSTDVRPRVASDGDGVFVVVWVALTTSSQSIPFARSDDLGASWTPGARKVNNDSPLTPRLDVALAHAGACGAGASATNRFTAVFSTGSNAVYMSVWDGFINRFDTGVLLPVFYLPYFGLPAFVGVGGSYTHVSLAMGADGQAVVAWTDESPVNGERKMVYMAGVRIADADPVGHVCDPSWPVHCFTFMRKLHVPSHDATLAGEDALSSVATDCRGNFTVSWQRTPASGAPFIRSVASAPSAGIGLFPSSETGAPTADHACAGSCRLPSSACDANGLCATVFTDRGAGADRVRVVQGTFPALSWGAAADLGLPAAPSVEQREAVATFGGPDTWATIAFEQPGGASLFTRRSAASVTSFPSVAPTVPTGKPSAAPSRTPSAKPSAGPSAGPSRAPQTSPPSPAPTAVPSVSPSAAPSRAPSRLTLQPSASPDSAVGAATSTADIDAGTIAGAVVGGLVFLAAALVALLKFRRRGPGTVYISWKSDADDQVRVLKELLKLRGKTVVEDVDKCAVFLLVLSEATASSGGKRQGRDLFRAMTLKKPIAAACTAGFKETFGFHKHLDIAKAFAAETWPEGESNRGVEAWRATLNVVRAKFVETLRESGVPPGAGYVASVLAANPEIYGSDSFPAGNLT